VKLRIELDLASDQFTGSDDSGGVNWDHVETAILTTVGRLYATQASEPHAATLEIRDWNGSPCGFGQPGDTVNIDLSQTERNKIVDSLESGAQAAERLARSHAYSGPRNKEMRAELRRTARELQAIAAKINAEEMRPVT
jgi:hypothetical protein